MFWKYAGILLLFITSYVFVFKTNDIKNFSWAIRHGVDEEGERQQLLGMKFVGILFFLSAIIWIFV